MAEYEVWLCQDAGTRIALLDDWNELNYTLAARDIGTCSLTLPDVRPWGFFMPDQQVQVWRKPSGGAMSLERQYLIRRIQRETDTAGVRNITVEGVDGNDLLRRRIVAYSAGSTGASRAAAADSLMKDVVRDNLSTGSTDTDRTFSTSYFTIEPKSSAGPSINADFAHRDVLGLCQEWSEASKESTGPETFFDVCSPTPGVFEFRTYITQIGMDHTYPDGQNPVLLGLEYGNLTEPALEEDYTEEHTVVYGGGQGEGSARYVYEIEDATRSGRSIWGRSEAFKDARNADSTTAVEDEARAALAEGKPRIRFAGQIMDTPGTRYGIQWRWGDKLTALYNNQAYNAAVDVVHVKRTADTEEIDARIRYEE